MTDEGVHRCVDFGVGLSGKCSAEGCTSLDGVDQAFAELFREHQIQQLHQVSLHGTQARAVSCRSSHARAKLNHGHEVGPQTHVKRTARYKSLRSNCTDDECDQPLRTETAPAHSRREECTRKQLRLRVCKAVGVSV